MRVKLKHRLPNADEGRVSELATPGQFLRRLAPFLAAASLAFVLVAVSSGVDVGEFGVALALTGAAVGLGCWLRRLGAASTLDVVPLLVFLLSASVLRNAGGGIGSGVGVVALLPVVWIALHGDRRQLAAILAGVAVFYLAPIVLIGGAAYPASGYRTAVLFVVISAIIGFTVQRLVEQIRRHADAAEGHQRDLEHVAAVSRRIATSPDARTDVCRAACEVSGATFAVLLEPDCDDRLRSTAMAGLDAPPFGSAPVSRGSAPVLALTTHRSIFVADAATSELLNRRLWAAHGAPASMRFEPVLRGGTAAGVLVLAWAEPVSATYRTAALRLLATEAAIAIERADLVEQLNGLAMTDPLTGVDNRRAWDAGLDRVLAVADDEHDAVTVALLDLDHFKAFNDARGHQSGDLLLQEAAAAWRDLLRPGDRLARYGGEEFIVLLPACDEAQAMCVVERLRGAVPAGETCSAGVAQWNGTESADTLVGRADAALYVAKAAGRDRAVAAR
jgi:diguanylate cyclase (GGDEF)-like protein